MDILWRRSLLNAQSPFLANKYIFRHKTGEQILFLRKSHKNAQKMTIS